MKTKAQGLIRAFLVLAAISPMVAHGADARALEYQTLFESAVAELEPGLQRAADDRGEGAAKGFAFNLWPTERVAAQVRTDGDEMVVDLATGAIGLLEQLSTAMAVEVLYHQRGCFGDYVQAVFPTALYGSISPASFAEHAARSGHYCRTIPEEDLISNPRFVSLKQTMLDASLRFLLLYQAAYHLTGQVGPGMTTLVDLRKGLSSGSASAAQYLEASAMALASAPTNGVRVNSATPALFLIAAMNGIENLDLSLSVSSAFIEHLKQRLVGKREAVASNRSAKHSGGWTVGEAVATAVVPTAGAAEAPSATAAPDPEPQSNVPPAGTEIAALPAPAPLHLGEKEPAVAKVSAGPVSTPPVAHQSLLLAVALALFVWTLLSRVRNRRLIQHYEKNYYDAKEQLDLVVSAIGETRFNTILRVASELNPALEDRPDNLVMLRRA